MLKLAKQHNQVIFRRMTSIPFIVAKGPLPVTSNADYQNGRFGSSTNTQYFGYRIPQAPA
jgi:hypothetical protein